MWIWVVVAFFAGAFMGVMLTAICSANTASEHKRWWEE